MLRRAIPRRHLSVAASHASKYSLPSELDVQHFASVVGGSNVITDEEALAPYNTDWMRQFHGASRIALRPSSTEEISQILSHCNAQKIAVVPQGGNTGLVGGSVPLSNEVVLSLSRMNQVISLDEYAGHLVCEAGCVLEALQAHVAERGYTMPLDLGAKGSCQVRLLAPRHSHSLVGCSRGQKSARPRTPCRCPRAAL